MELVLKQPVNKPPFIGLLFSAHYEASNNNQDLVIDAKRGRLSNPIFNLCIDVYGDHCNLKIVSTSPITIRIYKRVKYDHIMLENWLRATTLIKQYNFGHIILINGVQQIAKTTIWNYNFVLKLHSITLSTGEPDLAG
jgi:hypothetical protein